MKKIFGILIALVIAESAFATGITLTGAGKAPGGAAYVGPVDINGTAFAIWSTRCPSNAFSGTILDIVDSATGTTTGTRLQCAAGGTISALVSGAACATTTGGGTFVTGGACSPLATTCATACRALTIYDTSGSNNCTGAPCDLTNTTNANRPVLTSSCLSGKICLVGDGTSACLGAVANNTALAQPMTFSIVANRTGGTTLRQFTVGNNSSDITVGYQNSTNTTWAIAGNNNIIATASDNATHAIQFILTQTPANNSSSWYIDGSTTGANDIPGANGFTATKINIMSSGGCAINFFNGNFFELGLWASDKSANNSTMNSNQHAYWAF